MERSSVQYGRTRIEYTIRRSTRRRTVAITIDADAGVVVTAPMDAPVEKLDKVVHRKAKWIAERLRRRSSLPPAPPAKELVSGESFSYLGRHYRLKVKTGAVERPVVRLVRGWLTVTVPMKLASMQRAHVVKAALVRWYARHAASRLPARVVEWSKKVGVPAPPVLVRSQRKRWASCDEAGVLRFNWRIIQAPMRLVDYVVAHELVHLVHPDHTNAFWRRLGRAMPDYEERRGRLREVGRGFEW